MTALVVTGSGPLAGTRFELDGGDTVLGREDAAITIDDEELSRRHAVVRLVDDRLEIEDLGSLNGTFVNGERIAGARMLSGGDTVRIGSTTLAVEARSTATVVSARPSAPVTRVAPVPAPPPAPAPAMAPMAAERREAPAEPFGHYAPQAGGRARIASRRLTPQLFTTACIVGTAVALVLYFAQH